MRAVAVLAFALLPLGLVAGAECLTTSSFPIYTYCNDGLCYYFAFDPCQFECLFSIWSYEEVNGMEGLQRHDEVVDDTCGGQILGDAIIF